MRHSRLALACLLTDGPEEAVAHARKTIEGNRNFALPYCVLAAAYARLGRAEEAPQAVRRLIRLAPSFRLGSLRKIRFAHSRGCNPTSYCCAKQTPSGAASARSVL